MNEDGSPWVEWLHFCGSDTNQVRRYDKRCPDCGTERPQGYIQRIDKYNIIIDNVTIPATPEQETRIRSLNEAELILFKRIMGG